MTTITPQQRYRGALLGLATGDALGTTLEFRRPGTFEPTTDMVGGGPFNLEPGQWTDDTSLALCLATSLVTNEGEWNPTDQMERYVRWWRSGYLSSNGRCFDIGNTTRSSLARFCEHDGADPYVGSENPRSAGNGSLMRLAPVPMLYAEKPTFAIDFSGLSSITTHAAKTCIDACRYFGGLIVAALNGEPKAVICSERFAPHSSAGSGRWEKSALHPEVETVAEGSFREKEPPEINGKGYVVSTLEAALWAFYSSNSFVEGALKVVNLGDDADTTGAVYGQLAGAYYGEGAIPKGWREKLAMRSTIEGLADELFDLSERMVFEHPPFAKGAEDLINPTY